ncbi:Transposon Tf2-6 polyprotein [Labeo rohita]|uniref:Gypsy retrotransposon integrase-like protein 1 n=1 Tax=Labeo rohita TaxID=84645 RepID=A0ABQ8LJC3_LABRO|nr:Transposon Tf2-6 polyprotein [Labeo rohita]
MLDYCEGHLSSPSLYSREYRSADLFYILVCVRVGTRISWWESLLRRRRHLWGVLQQQTTELVNLRQELVGCRAEITALRSETAGLRAECANLRSDLTALQADHDDLAAAQTPPAEPIHQIPPSNQPKISLPDKWDGSGTRCDVFLTNLSLVFEFQPSRYPTDCSRIALLTSLLTGQAAEWATAVLRADGDSAHLYPAFTAELRTAFQHPESEVETTWSDAALRTAYYEGLSNRLKDELAVRELPATLEGMIQLALRVDQRMSHSTKSVFRSFAGSTSHQRSPEPSTFHAVTASPPPPPVASEAHSGRAGEPMQIGRTSLSAAERARRYREGLCAYCASPDHHRAICPLRPGNGQRSEGEVSILLGHQRIVTTAFVDSGAAGNFIDQAYAAQLGIVTEVLSQPLNITAIDENIQFYITKISSPPIILGHPWLVAHDPFISWTSNRIVHWGATCQELCLRAKVGTCSGESEASDVDLEAIPVQYRDLAEVFSKRSAARPPPHRPYDPAIDLVPGATNIELWKSTWLRDSAPVPSTGFFFVKKKDGGLRPCVDYRGLNQITIKNRHPLSLTNTALDALSGAHFFTKLDLRSAYNLVRIREGDEWKTAFLTPTGHYETLVMPFGLCNSPAAFQHFINDVLRDMLGRWCYAYLDDILIYSKTLEEHTQHVRAVLQRLLAHQLFCKLEKCAFHQHTTTFLGFVISAQGVAMDPQKLEAVRSWPLPTSLKQLQRFLGFANFYRRFIRGFSSTAAPLTALTKPSRGEFHLTPEAIQAFKTLCHQFTSAPVLIHPDPARSFIMEVDAADVGVGAVLSQRGPDEKLHPCSFFSRKFNLTQQRYGVGDRELLAIKWALEEWRHWLQGGSDPFTVWTDHQNLTVIRQAKQLNPRQARWALFFEHFNFHLSYRPGSKNTKADALSRQHQKDTTSSEPAPVLPPHIILAFLRWGLEERVRQGHGQEPPPSDTPTGRLFVPSALRQEVLQWGHDSTLPGHPGVQRTISFISRAFWWRTLRRDVQEYVQACNICARSKTINAPSTGELQPLPLPKRPWTHISLDFVTGLPESQGKNTILTIVDCFSKAVHLVALSGLPSAKTTAELILEHVVHLHGFPKDIVSDRGPQFTAKFWQAFCRLVGTTSSLYLVWAELSNNLHTFTTTGLSPFEVCYGFQPPIFEHQEPEVEVPSAQQLVRRCRRLWNHARAAIQKTNRRYIIQHRRRHPPGRLFHVGDRVYLSTRNINLKTDSKKLTSRHIGPFKITHRLNPVTFRLQLPASLRIHPVFHQSQLKPVFFSPLSPQIPTPPHPGLLTVVLPTPFGESSTRAAVAVASSISSTGKATVRRSGLGFPDGSYWIPLSSRTTVVGYPPLRDRLVPVLEGGTERSQINRVANLLTRVFPRMSSPPRYTGTFPRSFISCLASVT